MTSVWCCLHQHIPKIFNGASNVWKCLHESHFHKLSPVNCSIVILHYAVPWVKKYPLMNKPGHSGSQLTSLCLYLYRDIDIPILLETFCFVKLLQSVTRLCIHCVTASCPAPPIVVSKISHPWQENHFWWGLYNLAFVTSTLPAAICSFQSLAFWLIRTLEAALHALFISLSHLRYLSLSSNLYTRHWFPQKVLEKWTHKKWVRLNKRLRPSKL